MAEKAIMVVSTFPRMADARRICKALVVKGMAACANIVKIEKSIYRWRGKVCGGPECAAFIKARERDYLKIEKAIKSMHPYEVPEIISFRIEKGNPGYIAWVLGRKTR
jgi:periplasmic divalent cation tolerance protein